MAFGTRDWGPDTDTGDGVTGIIATNAPVLPGEWQTVEWYLKTNSAPGVQDGIIRIWIDGALAAERTNVTFPNSGITGVSELYEEGENNGNYAPGATSRTIYPVAAKRWVSAFRISQPAP